MIDFRSSRQPKTLSLFFLLSAAALLFTPKAFAQQQQFQFTDQTPHNEQIWSNYNAPRQSQLHRVGLQQQYEDPAIDPLNLNVQSDVEPNAAGVFEAQTEAEAQAQAEAYAEAEADAESHEIGLEELAKEITALQAKDLPPYTATYDLSLIHI